MRIDFHPELAAPTLSTTFRITACAFLLVARCPNLRRLFSHTQPAGYYCIDSVQSVLLYDLPECRQYVCRGHEGNSTSGGRTVAMSGGEVFLC